MPWRSSDKDVVVYAISVALSTGEAEMYAINKTEATRMGGQMQGVNGEGGEIEKQRTK